MFHFQGKQPCISCEMYPPAWSSTLVLSLNLCAQHNVLFNLIKSDLKNMKSNKFQELRFWTTCNSYTPDKAEWHEAALRFHWRGPEFAPMFPRILLPAEDFDVTNALPASFYISHVSSVSCSAAAKVSVNMGQCDQTENASR